MDGTQINYGDFVLFKIGNVYLSIVPEFEKDKMTEKQNKNEAIQFTFRAASELSVMDINYFLFQILPNDETLPGYLFGEENQPFLDFTFSKEDVFKKMSEKFKFPVEVGLDKEVRLFNPFFCAFLTYDPKLSDKENVCRFNRKVDGPADWSSVFKLKVESQKIKAKMLNDYSSLTLQASKNGDYNSKDKKYLSKDISTQAGIIKLFESDVNNPDKKETGIDKLNRAKSKISKVLNVMKYMSFQEFRTLRFGMSRRYLTPLDYFRIFSNFDGEEFYLSSLQEEWGRFGRESINSNLGFINKSEMECSRFLSIFQLMEHDNIEFKSIRELNMYSLPFTTSDQTQAIDSKYRVKNDIHYTMHLPLNMSNFEKRSEIKEIPYFPYCSHLFLNDKNNSKEIGIQSPIGKPDKKSKMFFLNKIDEVSENKDYWEPIKEDTTFYVGYAPKEDSYSSFEFITKGGRHFKNSQTLIHEKSHYLTDIDGIKNLMNEREINFQKKQMERALKIEQINKEYEIELNKIKNLKREGLLEKIRNGEIEEMPEEIILENNEIPVKEEVPEISNDDFINLPNDRINQFCVELQAKSNNPKTIQPFTKKDGFDFEFNKLNEKNESFISDMTRTPDIQNEIMILKEDEVIDIYRLISLKKQLNEIIQNNSGTTIELINRVCSKVEIINQMLNVKKLKGKLELFDTQNIIHELNFTDKILKFLDSNFEEWKVMHKKNNKMDDLGVDESAKKDFLGSIDGIEIGPILPKDTNRFATPKKDIVEEEGIPLLKNEQNNPRMKDRTNIIEIKDNTLVQKIEKKTDTFIEFFTLISFNNVSIKNWFVKNMNILFKMAKTSQSMQNFLVTKIIENNKSLESSIDLIQIYNIWEIINNQMNILGSEEDPQDTQVSGKIVILKIFNRIYKDISLIDQGSSLITFLKFFMKEEYIRSFLFSIVKPKDKVDKYYLEDFNHHMYKECLVKAGDKIEKENSEYSNLKLLKELLALTYHVPRISNVYYMTAKLLFEKNKNSEDEMFNVCTEIVKNNKFNSKIRGEVLELISSLFFHNFPKLFPEEVILSENISNGRSMNRIKDMKDIYENSCLDLANEHIIVKTLVQKRMILFNANEVYISDAIKLLLEGYKKIEKDIKPDAFENISKTLARLCDAYKLNIAKSIYSTHSKSGNFNEKLIKDKISSSIITKLSKEINKFVSKNLDIGTVSTMAKKIENISKFTVSFTDILSRLKIVFVIQTKNAEIFFDQWENAMNAKIEIEKEEKTSLKIINDSLVKMFECLMNEIIKKKDDKLTKCIYFQDLESDSLSEYDKLTELFSSKASNPKFLSENNPNGISFLPLNLLTDKSGLDKNSLGDFKERFKNAQEFLYATEYVTSILDTLLYLLLNSRSKETFMDYMSPIINATKLILFYIEGNFFGAEELAEYLMPNEIFAELCKENHRMFHTKRAILLLILMRLYSSFKGAITQSSEFIANKLSEFINTLSDGFNSNNIESFFRYSGSSSDLMCLKCTSLGVFLVRNCNSMFNCEFENELFSDLKKIYPENKALLEMESKRLAVNILIKFGYRPWKQFENHMCNSNQSHNFNPFNTSYPEAFKPERSIILTNLFKEIGKLLKKNNIEQIITLWNDEYYGGRIYWGVTMYKSDKLVYYYNKLYYHFFSSAYMIRDFKYEERDFRDLQYSYFTHIFINSGMIFIESDIKAKFVDSVSKLKDLEEFSKKIKDFGDYETLRNEVFVFAIDGVSNFKEKKRNDPPIWNPEMIEKFSLLMLKFFCLEGYEKIFFKYHNMRSTIGDLDEVTIFFGYFIEFLKMQDDSKFLNKKLIYKGIQHFYNLRKEEFKKKFEEFENLKNGYQAISQIIDELIPKDDKTDLSFMKIPDYKLGVDIEEESNFYIKIQRTKINYCFEAHMNPTLLKYHLIFNGEKESILKYFVVMSEASKMQIQNIEDDICQLLNITYAALHFYFENQITKKFQEYNSKVKEEEQIGQIVNLEEIVIKDLYRSLLNQGHMVDSLFKFIEKSGSPDILGKTLRLTNKLLENPFEEMQIMFYQKFMSDDYNRSLNNLLKYMKISISNLEDLEQKATKPMEPENFDRFTFSNYKKYVKSRNLLKSILVFFKSLCEGHYQDMQIFMFEQKEEGEAHENMVNVMETIIIKVLRVYANENFCKPANYDLGNTILDLLIEVIQGDVNEFVKDLIRQNELLVVLKQLYTNIHLSWQKYGSNEKKKNSESKDLSKSQILLLDKDLSLKDKKEKERRKKYIDDRKNQKVQMIRKIMQFIQSIIENSNTDVVKEILNGLDWIFIVKKEYYNIQEFLLRKQKKDKGAIANFLRHQINEKDFSQYVLPLVDFSVIKSTIDTLDPLFESELRKKFQLTNVSKTKAKESDSEIEKAKKNLNESIRIFNLLKESYTIAIEVVDNRGQIKTVYFPKPVICRYLMQKEKNEIIEGLDRTSYQTKIAEFLGKKNILMAKLREVYILSIESRSAWLKYMFGQFVKLSHFLVMIVINILLLSGTKPILKNIEDRNYGGDHENSFIVLVVIEIVLSCLYFLELIFSNQFYYEILSRWDSYAQMSRKYYGNLTDSEIIDWIINPTKMKQDDFIRLYTTMGPKNPFFFINKEWKKKLLLRLYFLGIHLQLVLDSLPLFRAAMYILFSALILAIHPVFAPILVLIKLLEFKTIKNVLRSLYQNWREFSMTIFFGIAVILIYSSIGFYAINNAYFLYDDDTSKVLCPNLWRCFLSIINYGVRGGGGIGDELFQIYKFSWMYYAARWFNDFIFYVLIIVILLNLIFGIIIDTFSDITSKVESERLDQITKCFICNFEKETINQKILGGFDSHLKFDHNMWNYIFYLIYLCEKGVMDLSSLESHVWSQFKSKKLEWIPYNRSAKMEAEESDETKIKNEIFDDLETIVDVYQNLENILKDKDLLPRETKISLLTKKMVIVSDLSEKSCFNEYLIERDFDDQKVQKMNIKAYKISGYTICQYCVDNCHLGKASDGGKKMIDPFYLDSASTVCQCWNLPESRFNCIRSCSGIQFPNQLLGSSCKMCNTCGFNICKYCSELCHNGHDMVAVSNSMDECQCNDKLGCKVRKL